MPLTFRFSHINLPTPERPFIDRKNSSQCFATEAMMATIGHQAFPERARFWIGVTAQKFDDPRPMLHGWMAAIFFPIGISFFLQFET